MSRMVKVSALGALLAGALACSAAAALAAPPSVFVRVEGAGTTLLPQTQVNTTAAQRVRGKLCSGTSAAGALQLATAGGWTGSYSDKYKDFLVSSILGERPAGNDFWTLWINGRTSSTGACSTPLHPGDHELWFHCVADASFNCTNNPLGLKLPAMAQVGHPVAGSVVALDGAGHGKPVAGAAVSGPGIAGVSGAGGRVRLTFRRTGLVEIQARRSGTVPSDPVTVCVFRSRRSDCRAALAGPRVRIDGIREHAVFRTGPRRLHGAAGPDPAGLADVSLALRRRAPSGRCSYFDADRGVWRARGCRARVPRFSIGASASWSYLLPAPLPAGRYRLVVSAADTSGRRASDSVDFRVKR